MSSGLHGSVGCVHYNSGGYEAFFITYTSQCISCDTVEVEFLIPISDGTEHTKTFRTRTSEQSKK